MTKTLDIIHKDILGNTIKVGDIVTYPDHNRLRIGTVTKLNPKMINITPLGRKYPDRKYPSEIMCVDDPKITLYVLKNSK